MRVFYLFLLGVAAGVFLLLREWFDRKKEKSLDIEVVRENEEHLGNWASKSAGALILLRLHRNGSFTYKLVQYPRGDTVRTTGRYELVGVGNGRTINYYPRLVAVDKWNDTVLNFFIAYITPYDSHTESIDKMVLSPNGIYDTVSYTFYRVKP